MKITIDENVCKKHGLKFTDVLMLVLCKSYANMEQHLAHMERDGLLFKSGNCYYPGTMEIDDTITRILCESEPFAKEEKELLDFAKKLRELFPKGFKTGTTLWRGNVRDITLRLQKFFKIYGNQYSFEQIYEATKKYVESFNGNYTYMRTLKYFIMKSETKEDEEGNRHIEDVSDLASFLENDCVREDNDDWLLELR